MSSILGLLAVLALLLAATVSVFWPLLATRRARHRVHGDLALALARDAKLGEIQDLELDYQLGKLSSTDYEQLNVALRAEAVEIMRRLDATTAGNGNGGAPDGAAT
jgi:hypothetical protein